MKYLLTFIISFTLMVAALSALTLRYDPLHKTTNANFSDGIPAFGANAGDVLDMKIALFITHPKTKLILGNSRAQKGLRAETLGPEWFNAAIQGASISDQLDILKTLNACQKITNITLAIDLAMFNGQRGNAYGKTLSLNAHKNRCKNQKIPATAKDIIAKPLYFIDLANIIKIIKPTKQNAFNLQASETYDPQTLKLTTIKNDSITKIESYYSNAWSTKTAGTDFTTKTAKSDHLQSLEQFLAYTQGQNITVKIIALPLHNELLKVKYIKGLWPIYNTLRQNIKSIAAENNTQFYDFSGPNTFTAQPLFEKSKNGFYYKEPSHFTPLIGDEILKNLKKPTSALNIPQSTKTLEALLKQPSLAESILTKICQNSQSYYCSYNTEKIGN